MGGLPTNHLLRFAYPDGRALWVGSAEEPNSCVTTTNGTAKTPAYIGPGLAAAYREGVWRLPRRADPCAGVLGRRGQGESLVSGEPVEVLVCAHGRNGDPPRRLRHGERQAREPAAELDASGAEPGGNTCSGPSRDHFSLVFGYAEGPPSAAGQEPGGGHHDVPVVTDPDQQDAVVRIR
ncbi:hypothetical protein ACIBP6_15060 [Nonomuraea terrae]|uniref:hypothetical protein n=1 Tax=Nonomuraea terrae TaxID=2530383 RepID=UPI0037B67045